MYASDDDEREKKRLRSEQQQQPLFFFHLVEELITEILSWLPVESLVRFKCVSKSWNSLISHPSFIQLHFLRSSKLTHSLILSQTNTIPPVITLTYFLHNPSSPSFFSSDQQLFPLNQHYTVLGSCNGLVCLLHYKFSKQDSHHFLLWNPATRLLSQKFPCFCQFTILRRHLFGFGYDKSSHTYKVVCLSYLGDTTQLKVYTLGGGGGGGGWREIQRLPEFPFHIRVRTEGTFLSGTLNWVAIRNFTSPSETLNYNYDHVAIHNKYVIVSVDFGTETYKQISLPPFGRDEMPDKKYFDPVIEVFLNCLCLSYDYKKTHFIMWQMKEFGVEKSWTRFVKVSYEHLQFRQILQGAPRRMVVMCISQNGDVLILQKNYSEIILYNRRDNGVQVAPAPTIRNQGHEIYVKGYAQSLISPC